jgi:hypothetical protein
MADLAEVSSIPIRPSGDPPLDRREPGASSKLPKRPMVLKPTEDEQPEEENKHQVDVTV